MLNNKSRNVIKVLIFILAIVSLVILSNYVISYQQDITSLWESIKVTDIQEEVEIRPWVDNEKEEVYIFLPKCLDSIVFDLDKYNLFLNDLSIDDNTIFNLSHSSEDYSGCIFKGKDKLWSGIVHIIELGNIPSMYLTTETGTMDYLESNKKYSEKGTILLIESDGGIDYQGKLERISGRGNTTWQLPKKPYSFTLEGETSLLSMDNASEWVLLANYTDGSFIRNIEAYDSALELGMECVSQSTLIDLYLNGEYAGVYQLCQKVSAENGRIDCERGTLITKNIESRSIDSKSLYFWSARNNFYTFEDENYATINKRNEIESLINDFEDALYSDSGYNSSGKRFSDYIDMESFAVQYLITEVFGNQDANQASEYYYISAQNGKLTAGPIWDFDLSAGNGIFYIQQPCSIIAASNEDSWYYHLQKYDGFRQIVIKDFELLKDYLEDSLDSLSDMEEQLTGSVFADSVRWAGFEKSFYQHQEESFHNQIRYYVSYMKERINFLKEYWDNPENYIEVKIEFNVPNQLPAKLYLLPNDMIKWDLYSFNQYLLQRIENSEGGDVSLTDRFSTDVELKTYWKLQTVKTGTSKIVILLPCVFLFVLGCIIIGFDVMHNLKTQKGGRRKGAI